MAHSLDVGIVGYGIAGIAAAIQLRRRGHRITHLERNASPVTRGAGMLLHPPAVLRLQELGVATTAMACGTPVTRICAQTIRGRPLMDFGYEDVIAGQMGLGIQRGALHCALSKADSGHHEVGFGRKVTSLDPDRGYLTEESGVRHGPFDLVIVADGTHSLLRKQISSFMRSARRAKSAALVGLLDDPEGVASDRLTQYFDSTRHLSIWPVGRDSATANPKCSIAINVPLAEAATFRDAGTWRIQLARLCPRIGKLADGCNENSSLHIYTYHDAELRRLTVGRAVVIGDAAHSMSPQLGNGAQLGMEDAALLATAIDQHDLFTGLQTYAQTRRLQLRRYHRASRWLTPLFQSESRALALFRDHLFANTMRLSYAKRFAHALLC